MSLKAPNPSLIAIALLAAAAETALKEFEETCAPVLRVSIVVASARLHGMPHIFASLVKAQRLAAVSAMALVRRRVVFRNYGVAVLKGRVAANKPAKHSPNQACETSYQGENAVERLDCPLEALLGSTLGQLIDDHRLTRARIGIRGACSGFYVEGRTILAVVDCFKLAEIKHLDVIEPTGREFHWNFL